MEIIAVLILSAENIDLSLKYSHFSNSFSGFTSAFLYQYFISKKKSNVNAPLSSPSYVMRSRGGVLRGTFLDSKIMN